jgi:hypothetical protein
MPSLPHDQNADAHGLYSVQTNLQVGTYDHFIVPDDGHPDQYVSPESVSQGHHHFGGITPASQERYFQGTPRSPEEYFHDTHEQPEDEERYEETPRLPSNCEYFDEVTPNPEKYDTPGKPASTAPYTSSRQMDREHNSDEKKFGVEKVDMDSHLDNSSDFIREMKEDAENVMEPSGVATREHYFGTSFGMPNKYENPSHAGPLSPGEASANSGMDSQSHQSAALRGAHEILKRRRRRLEM